MSTQRNYKLTLTEGFACIPFSLADDGEKK